MTELLQTLAETVLTMSPWEVAAVLFAIVYLLLAVRENVWCWLFAFVSTAIYTVLFWDVALLMDSALNVYYMAMAVFGWYQWTRGGNDGNNGAQSLGVSSLTSKQNWQIITAIVLLSSISGYLLSEYSHAAWPYVDSFTTWASVFATYLITRKYLQNWLYWIVIDVVSIPLYIERGLNLTALLFAIYIVIAVIGYRRWKSHLQNPVKTNAA